MWHSLKSSVIGSQHVAQGVPCQDFSCIERLDFAGSEWLFISIADGAGSAKCAEVGAKYVASQWVEIAKSLVQSGAELTSNNLVTVAELVKTNLSKFSRVEGNKIGDYACTLLGAILNHDLGIFFQVGDGAWVAKTEDKYIPLTWPTKGEFANESIFITSVKAAQYYQTKTLNGLGAVAGFTDGLEGLSLVLKTKEVHQGFFEPMFAYMATCPGKDLTTSLSDFLNSVRVNERTDDDKTLVLLLREGEVCKT